jgi:MFS family permease
MFGKLYTLYPLKRVFLVTITISLIGSTVCATAQSSKALVVGRAISGLAFAGVLSGVFTALVRLFPLRIRSFWQSLLNIAETIAVVVAPVLGGVLTEKLNWRWCFW